MANVNDDRDAFIRERIADMRVMINWIKILHATSVVSSKAATEAIYGLQKCIGESWCEL